MGDDLREVTICSSHGNIQNEIKRLIKGSVIAACHRPGVKLRWFDLVKVKRRKCGNVQLTGMDPLTLIEANLPRSYIVPYFFPKGTYNDCCSWKLATYCNYCWEKSCKTYRKSTVDPCINVRVAPFHAESMEIIWIISPRHVTNSIGTPKGIKGTVRGPVESSSNFVATAFISARCLVLNNRNNLLSETYFSPSFPLDSMMSISPLSGHAPYVSASGSILKELFMSPCPSYRGRWLLTR